MLFQDKNYWALILGGSSGMGLAAAHKLSSLGMNIFLIHRDRKGAMPGILDEFEKIRRQRVGFHHLNTNALTADGKTEIFEHLARVLENGKIRVLLHSIALGNLKLLAPHPEGPSPAIDKLTELLQVPKTTMQKAIDDLFLSGESDLADLASPPSYNNEFFLSEEDLNLTINNMGSNLLTWVQDLHTRRMFCNDARVIGLTSEGNEIAWHGYAAVSAAKCALEAISRAIAREFAQFGIRCNIIQPGITDTPALRMIPGSLHMKARALKKNPMGRLTTPEDIANVISLLAQDEASWINGALIRADGGEHISG